MEKRKVIIDCDPGIDDSLAILLALNSSELEVLGTTVCSGNVPAKLGAKNASIALQKCSSLHVPIYVGEEIPKKRDFVTAQDTHGANYVYKNLSKKNHILGLDATRKIVLTPNIVEEGKAIVDTLDFYKEKKNAFVLKNVDEKKFMEMFLKRLFKDYESTIYSVKGVI